MSTLKVKYFVVSPSSRDDRHAIASRKAILAYANAIASIDEEFATQLCDCIEHLDLEDNREGK